MKYWWTIKHKEREYGSLSSELETAAGVSNRSSLGIPGVLTPDLLQYSYLGRLTDFKLLGAEEVETKSANKIDGDWPDFILAKSRDEAETKSAYKIEGRDWKGMTRTLWIDKQRFLILKVLEKNKFEPSATREGFETETTTFYDPQIDENVPMERLALDAE
ncbi:MAG: hypothetical protein J2P21_20290 [Chloracidobacterium sp.]|nr:hypothetical protein [Chloracidobacterium sp.]